jgi:hypothetical protein
MPSLPQRCLFVVLSDLHDPDAMPALKRLAQLHDCVVLQLEDPAERGWRGSGFFRAREAETGREFVTHGRRRWIDASQAASELKRCGIDDQPYAHSLRLLFRSRGYIGKGER